MIMPETQGETASRVGRALRLLLHALHAQQDLASSAPTTQHFDLFCRAVRKAPAMIRWEAVRLSQVRIQGPAIGTLAAVGLPSLTLHAVIRCDAQFVSLSIKFSLLRDAILPLSYRC